MDQPGTTTAPPPPGVIPPTRPGEIGYERPPVWPTPFAIIAVILAVLAMIGSLINALSPLMARAFEGMMPKEVGASYDVLTRHTALWIVYQVLYAACAVLLLVAAISLLHRRSRCAALFRVWAAARLPAIALGLLITAWSQEAQMEVLRQNPQGPPIAAAAAASFASFFSQAALVGMAIWWLAQATFVLWWFSRPKVKADIARWFRPA